MSPAILMHVSIIRKGEKLACDLHKDVYRPTLSEM